MEPFSLDTIALSILNECIKAKNQAELNQLYAWRDVYKAHGALYGGDADNFLKLGEATITFRVKPYNPWFLKKLWMRLWKQKITGLYELARKDEIGMDITILIKDKGNNTLTSEISSNAIPEHESA